MKRDLKTVDTVIFHMAASRADRDYTEEQLRKDHLARGINEPMGYHWYFRKDGTVVPGRPLDVIGAHAAPENKYSIGYCYEGGVPAGLDPRDNKNWKDTRTQAQKVSMLNQLYKDILTIREAGGMIKVIKGHNQVKGVKKPCPGFDATKEYYWIVA